MTLNDVTIRDDISSQVRGGIQSTKGEVNENSSYQRQYSLCMHNYYNTIVSNSFHYAKIATFLVNFVWGVKF